MPLNKKQTKIIKQGLNYTNQWWRKFNKRLGQDITFSNDYDEFLERTQDYTTNNILLNTGYSQYMSKLISDSADYSKLKRRELTHTTIEKTVGDLIVGVGEDLKYEIKTIVQKGYDLGYHSKDLAPLVQQRDLEALYIVPGEKTFTETQWQKLPEEVRTKYTFENNIKVMSPEQRSRTIARTEVARTQNIVNYVEASERGAKGYSVVCRPDCCEYCAEVYADITGEDYIELQESNNGRLIGGDIEFSMTDIGELPPFHPNCRCSAVFNY